LHIQTLRARVTAMDRGVLATRWRGLKTRQLGSGRLELHE
jgi:hypothetical protein